MNKKKIAEELNEWAKKEFGSLYCVEDDGDLTVSIKGRCVIWFTDFKKDKFRFTYSSDDLSVKLIKEGIIEKFYDKAIELMSEYESKYTVQFIKNAYNGFLNYNRTTRKYFLSDDKQGYTCETQFSKKEIDDLKNDENLAFNWNKAIIKEVKENEND